MLLTIALIVLALAVLYAIIKGTYIAMYLKKRGITQVELRQQKISANKMYKKLKTKKEPLS